MADAKTATQTALIRVTTGPDRGQTFELRDELTHLGTGDESQIRLTDSQLTEHELSIVIRQGRYAIYAAANDRVSVDSNLLPAERWVWLPESALIQVGKRTTLEFRAASDAAPAAAVDAESSPAEAPPAKSAPAAERAAKTQRTRKTAAGKRTAESRATAKPIARFITDQVGEPLVKLGEDGHLPVLHLEELADARKKRVKTETRQTNPLLVYGLVSGSFLLSMALLLIDTELRSRSDVDRTAARQQIEQLFFGPPEGELEEYQILLREAQLAHSRGDHEEEQGFYRRVLSMLTAEDRQGLIRLTKSREGDEKLRDLLSILLLDE